MISGQSPIVLNADTDSFAFVSSSGCTPRRTAAARARARPRARAPARARARARAGRSPPPRCAWPPTCPPPSRARRRPGSRARPSRPEPTRANTSRPEPTRADTSALGHGTRNARGRETTVRNAEGSRCMRSGTSELLCPTLKCV